MKKDFLTDAPILAVGAGIMGLGIAQVAAQAGHQVMIYDSRAGAVGEACAKLGRTLDALVVKGKLSAQAVAQTLSRIQAIDSLAVAARCSWWWRRLLKKLMSSAICFCNSKRSWRPIASSPATPRRFPSRPLPTVWRSRDGWWACIFSIPVSYTHL